MPNGAVLAFRHGRSEEAFMGPSLTFAYVDQLDEMNEGVYDYLDSRLRDPDPSMYPQLFSNANPNGHQWQWRRFKRNQDLIDRGDEEADKDYRLIEVSMYDNPYLTPDYIRNMEKKPKRWYRRMVLGSWDNFSGQVYEEFDEKIHVADRWDFPKMAAHGVGFDFGQTNASCAIVFGIDYDGVVYALEEYYKSDKLIFEQAEEIKHMISRYPDMSLGLWADPSIFHKNKEHANARVSIADLFAQPPYNLSFKPAMNDVAAGIQYVQERLHVDREAFHPFLMDVYGKELLGSPKYFIARQCRNLIEEKLAYHYEELPENQMFSKPNPESPVKYRDHSQDAERYFMTSQPRAPKLIQSPREGTFAAVKENIRLMKEYKRLQGRKKKFGRPVLGVK